MPREMIFLIASPIVIAIVLLVAWLLWTRRRPRIRRRALAVVAVLFLAASWWSQWFWLGQVPRFLFLHEEFGGLLRYALVMRPGIAEGDADDQSLLEGAIEERNRVVLERLLAAGLAVDNRLRPGQGLPDWLRQDDDDGDDPCAKPPPTRELGLIHEAARTGDRGLVELLLEHGAELELQDSYGWTPLHHAVEAHGLELVRDLLDRGASPNVLSRGPATCVRAGRRSDDVRWVPERETPLSLVLRCRARLGGPAAAERCPPSLITLLLERGADPNLRGDGGNGPLYYAVEARSLAHVRLLVDAGADVTGASGPPVQTLLRTLETGYVPLRNPVVALPGGGHAHRHNPPIDDATRSDLEAIWELLSRGKGACPSKSELHAASWYGDLGAVSSAIGKGVAVDRADLSGNTALYYAIERGHAAVVEALLGAGASPVDEHTAWPDSRRDRPIDQAVFRGDPAVVRAILDAGSIDVAGLHPDVLSIAAGEGHAEVVELLLARGARNEPESRSFSSPLYSAAVGNQLATAKLLLEAGADASAGSRNPLSAAIENGNRALVDLLLANGASLESRYETPLLAAAKAGNLEVAVLLLDRGADPDRGPFGSPLSAAVEKQHRELVELLLARGAKVNSGEPRPLGVAVAAKDLALARLLLEHGAHVNGWDHYHKIPIMTAVSQGDLKMAELLFERGARLDLKRDYDKQTLLHLACGSGNLELVKLIHGKGFDVNVRAGNGTTPIMMNADEGWFEVAEYLIEHGADVNAKTDYGRTALHGAADFDNFELAELLIRHGARVDVPDKDGETPLAIAQRHRNEKLAQLLQ